MRRLFFAALAVLAAGGAFWLKGQGTRSSFAAYNGDQLRTLEVAYRSTLRNPPVGPAIVRSEAVLDAHVSLHFLDMERARRRALLGTVLVALLATVGALLPRKGGTRTRRGEEQRLARAIGDPAALLEGERHRAARLLGVTLEAPPAVVDAALAAQLAAHDLGRLDGLAPDLRRIVLDQRQALQRARDLLVNGSGRDPSAAASQQ